MVALTRYINSQNDCFQQLNALEILVNVVALKKIPVEHQPTQIVRWNFLAALSVNKTWTDSFVQTLACFSQFREMETVFADGTFQTKSF